MKIKLARQNGKSSIAIEKALENMEMECKCNVNCNPNSSKWCNTIVFEIYKNDKLEELPNAILKQMVLALQDKIMNN